MHSSVSLVINIQIQVAGVDRVPGFAGLVGAASIWTIWGSESLFPGESDARRQQTSQSRNAAAAVPPMSPPSMQQLEALSDEGIRAWLREVGTAWIHVDQAQDSLTVSDV